MYNFHFLKERGNKRGQESVCYRMAVWDWGWRAGFQGRPEHGFGLWGWGAREIIQYSCTGSPLARGCTWHCLNSVSTEISEFSAARTELRQCAQPDVPSLQTWQWPQCWEYSSCVYFYLLFNTGVGTHQTPRRLDLLKLYLFGSCPERRCAAGGWYWQRQTKLNVWNQKAGCVITLCL